MGNDQYAANQATLDFWAACNRGILPGGVRQRDIERRHPPNLRRCIQRVSATFDDLADYAQDLTSRVAALEKGTGEQVRAALKDLDVVEELYLDALDDFERYASHLVAQARPTYFAFTLRNLEKQLAQSNDHFYTLDLSAKNKREKNILYAADSIQDEGVIRLPTLDEEWI